MAEKFEETAIIIRQEEIADDIYSMWLHTDQIAAHAKAGQFVSVYCNDGSRLLPRPISICEIDKKDGAIRLVYRVAGKGTAEFSSMHTGAQLRIVGPLGNGFPKKEKKAFLIGGGIGRWAESIIPEAGYYLGTDFSGEMIKIAQQRCSFENADYDFINVSFQEACRRSSEKLQRKFDRVVIGGVCMYINDADLKDCIAGLIDLLDEHCIMYLTETVAVETRLTLDECPSDALKTTYDVIYRTPSEYNAYYEVFKNAGFRIVKQDYLPHLNNEASFSETDRWYTILER